MSYRAVSDMIKAEAVRLVREEQRTYDEVSVRLGVCAHAIGNWVRQAGGVTRSRRSRYSEAQKTDAIQLLDDGLTQHTVSTRLGIPCGTVAAWSRQRSAPPVKSPLRAEAERLLRDEGYTVGAIAKRLEVGSAQISLWLRLYLTQLTTELRAAEMAIKGLREQSAHRESQARALAELRKENARLCGENTLLRARCRRDGVE